MNGECGSSKKENVMPKCGIVSWISILKFGDYCDDSSYVASTNKHIGVENWMTRSQFVMDEKFPSFGLKLDSNSTWKTYQNGDHSLILRK